MVWIYRGSARDRLHIRNGDNLEGVEMNYKLGKHPAKQDRLGRTLKLSAILKDMPPIPLSYDFDTMHPGVDMPMFLNDRLGDCVIAGRSHMTRRMELIEQGVVIPITDDEVKTEYFAESGGQDSGLNMLDSLNAWRKGWKVSGQIYTIDAFAEVDPANQDHVEACIYLLNGIYTGVQLPLRAQQQLEAGEDWHLPLMSLARDTKGSWGGHCIYVVSYDCDGLTCITWGKRQRMTWEWFAQYCDEAFGIVDNSDSWLSKPGIDVNVLEDYLKEVAK